MDIRQFQSAILLQDAEAIRAFFHPDACVRWHCTNEEFTVSEFIRANCEYGGCSAPVGGWDGQVERVETAGDTIIAVTHVYPKDRSASFHVTSFAKVENDRIVALDEYWADDGAPPEWRTEMNIGRRISDGDKKSPTENATRKRLVEIAYEKAQIPFHGYLEGSASNIQPIVEHFPK